MRLSYCLKGLLVKLQPMQASRVKKFPLYYTIEHWNQLR